MINELEIQKECVRLLNKWSEGYETELLEQFASWINVHSENKYIILSINENYGKDDIWKLVEI